MNDTIAKFGYPASLVREYGSWVVLLRPQQATLGSLVLAHKSAATSAAELDVAAWAELATITAELEATLRGLFGMDKINYLMLMMVDREVHYHVIPRYAEARSQLGVSFADPGWPKTPDLAFATDLTPEQVAALTELLRQGWVVAAS